MGGDGNPEQSENPTKPQETEGKIPSWKTLLYQARNISSLLTDTLPKRAMSKAIRIGLVPMVVMAGAQLLQKISLVSADSPSPPRSATELVLQDTAGPFADLKKTPEELIARPDIASTSFLKIGTGGIVEEIYTAAATDITDIYQPKDFYLYRSILNRQTGKLSQFEVISEKLPFYVHSIAVSGKKKLLTGETWRGSQQTAVYFSPDDGQPFTLVADFPIKRGVANETRLLQGTNKILVNVLGWETNGSIAIFDSDTVSAVKTLWADQGWTTRKDLAVVGTQRGETRILSSGGMIGLSRGYTDIVLDPLTGQVFSAQAKHSELDYAGGFFVTQDAAGQADKILFANIDGMFYTVDGKTDQVSQGVYFQDWLDNRGFPNYRLDSFYIYKLLTAGNIIWAGGAGGDKPVLAAWPVDANPKIQPDSLTPYRFGWSSIQDLQFGNFGGMTGILSYLGRFGFSFLETAADGRPIPGASPIFIGQGLGEPPLEQPRPVNRVSLPVLYRNYSGK